MDFSHQDKDRLSMLFAPAVQPETYLQLLARSFNLYQQGFRRTCILALLLSLVVFIPRLLAFFMGQPGLFSFFQSYYHFFFVVIYLAAVWLFAAVYWRVHCVAINKQETYLNDFKTAGKKIVLLFCAAFMILALSLGVIWVDFQFHVLLMDYKVLYQNTFPSSVLTFFVVLLEALLPFYVSVLFLFYFPLIVLENDKIFLALKQSFSLVWGNVWRVFSFQITPWIFYLLLITILKVIFQFDLHILFVPLNDPQPWPVIVLHMILFSLFIPWAVAAMIVQLHDLELRKALSAKK